MAVDGYPLNTLRSPPHLRAKTRKKGAASAVRSAGDRPRREDILHAATKEFSAKGFHGATTAGIARAAGVAQPLVHHHFGSKQGLWEAVLSDLFDELQTLQEGTIRDLRSVDLAASLKILLRQFVLFSARRPELARIMVQEGAPTKGFDPSLERHLRPQMERLEQLLLQLVSQYRVPLSQREVQLLCCIAIGASTHPFVMAGSVRRIFGLHVSDVEVAHLHADTVVRILFWALEAASGHGFAGTEGRLADGPVARVPPPSPIRGGPSRAKKRKAAAPSPSRTRSRPSRD